MYDELVKRLRYCSEETNGCGTCALSDDCVLRIGLLHKAADAIEELSKPRWIPVTERLPEEKDSGFSDDVLILVEERDGDFLWKDVYSGYYLYDAVSSETGWWAQMPQNCQRIKERFSVTHWMPLPEPPEGEETE